MATQQFFFFSVFCALKKNLFDDEPTAEGIEILQLHCRIEAKEKKKSLSLHCYQIHQT